MMDQEILKLLLKADDYRGFLKKAFEYLSDKHAHFSYSFFAKKAGFASRSFAREVALGNKRITAKSLPKFIKGLDLEKDYAEYFKLLVYEAEPDCRDKAIKEKELGVLRRRYLERLRQFEIPDDGNEDEESFFHYRTWPIVYTSLGDKNGETFENIVARCGLNRLDVREALRGMQHRGMISYDEATQRYCGKNFHILIKRLGTNKFFKEYFLACLEQTRARAEQEFDSKETLFFQSVFTVKRAHFLALRKDLSVLLTKFIDDNEIQTGDAVCQVNLGCLVLKGE